MERADDRYRALLERLVGARRRGVVFGLERVRACLDRLGAPDRRHAALQIGGTNGKGSTAAFAASVLAAAGARVGLYTSPHLCRLGERVVIGGVEATREELCAAGDAVAAAGGAELTFFEQITCMAAWLFAERAVDVAVLEVGLGGRLDATTACAAEVAVVTGVALDHQSYLGDSLEAIAAEKGAIFRRGRPAVVGASGEAAGQAMLRAMAEAAGAEPIAVVDARAEVGGALGIAGAFQRANAAAAVAACRALAARGAVAVSEAAIADGLAGARLAGRCERVRAGGRDVLFDVGHNPAAARALAAELPADRGVVLVLALSADKDAGAVARALAPRARLAIATAAHSDRARPATEVAAALGAAAPQLAVEVAADVPAAVDRALALAAPGELVAIAGSVFAVGEARAHILGEPVDPIVTTDPVAAGARG